MIVILDGRSGFVVGNILKIRDSDPEASSGQGDKLTLFELPDNPQDLRVQ